MNTCKKAYDSQHDRAASHGFSRAVELYGGDTKTLKDFLSSTATRPSEMLPARQNLPMSWVQTVCPAARSKGKDFVWLRRVANPTNFRHILVPCDELAKLFENIPRSFRHCPPSRQASGTVVNLCLLSGLCPLSARALTRCAYTWKEKAGMQRLVKPCIPNREWTANDGEAVVK